MGYCTKYKLDVKSENKCDIIADLRKNNEDARYAIDANGKSIQPCKWYRSEREMVDFSRNYPETLFTLTGYGEIEGDVWIKYFLNGKTQIAEAIISFPDFDPKKLEERFYG